MSIYLDPLIDDLAELTVNGGLVISMAAIADPSRHGADVPSVFFGPPDEFKIFIARFHWRLSSIFSLTSLI